MNTLFIVLLALLVVLAVVFAVGAAYITRHEGEEREEFYDAARRRAAGRQGDGREFYKSLGLGTGEQIKIRLFTLDEYRDELGGEADSRRRREIYWRPQSLQAFRRRLVRDPAGEGRRAAGPRGG